MQVILLEKVANLGVLGDVVKVKDGYARNFLIPTGAARRATEKAIKEFEVRRAELEKAQADKLAAAQAQGEKLAGKTVTISPCALSIDTIGAAADGASAERNASLVLGTTPSSPTPAAVAISPTGEVSIGGTVVGKTPLKPTTGAGS